MPQFLYVTEYENLGQSNQPNVAREVEIKTQVLTVSGTATASASFNKATTLVRVQADTSCAIVFATLATATATSQRLPANVVEYRAIPSNTTTQLMVSVIGIQ